MLYWGDSYVTSLFCSSSASKICFYIYISDYYFFIIWFRAAGFYLALGFIFDNKFAELIIVSPPTVKWLNSGLESERALDMANHRGGCN